MSIRKTIIVTAAIVASVAMVAPSFAGAVTVADLQAQINALLAQLQTLQGQPSDTGGIPSACIGITLTRNLTVGSTGSDVKCLQALLNTSTTTQVALTGAGSPGSETSYFGQLTLAAVKKYQVAHGWTPANQAGPLTRAALNATLGGTVVVTPGQPPVVVPTGAGLSVQLAADNPASGIVVNGQGLAPLAKFVFVNGDNAAVKVTSFKVTRIGISADADLANVYLMQGATRLTDAASVSSGTVNFNDSTGLFTVPSGSSVEITVASDVCAKATCATIIGQTIGASIASAASVTTNASSVRGNFPVNGNLMTISDATLATVQFSATTTPSTATSVIPQNDYTVWQNTAVVGTRNVNMTRIALREVGSINYTDLRNFRLYIDGVQVGAAVANLDSNGYVTFDLTSSPVALQAGSRVIKVLGDIIGGSSRTFDFSIRVAADANFIDSQYGVNIAPTTATAPGTSFTLADVTAGGATGSQTIASGTLTITKTTDSPSGNIVDNSSNAVLARYTLTAAGEPVKISSFNVRGVIDSADCNVGGTYALRNGAIYANGVQIGSTTNLGYTAAGTAYNFGSSLVVNPGSPVTLEVRADIYDAGLSSVSTTNCVDSDDVIYAEIVKGSSNAQGMVSLTTISTPSAAVDGNSLTDAVGALTLSKYTAYTNRNAVVPLTNYKLGDFTLTNGTVEAINVNTIKVYLNYVSADTTNLYVTYGPNQTQTTPTPAVSNSYSVNYQLPVGQTIDLSVYGDIDAAATYKAGTGQVSVYVTATTANSAQTVYGGVDSGPDADSDDSEGQVITFTTGSFATAVDGSTPLAGITSGGQSVVAGKFKITASNDQYTVQELRFTVAGDVNGLNDSGLSESAAIQTLTLLDGTTVLANVPYDSSNLRFTITGLNLVIPANTSKVLTAQYNLSVPSTDGTTITTGKNTAVTLSYVKYINSQGSVGTSSTGRTGNYLYVYKSVPTFTTGTVTGQGVNLTSGSTTTLYNFSVGADSKGPIALKQLKFNVTVTDGDPTAGVSDGSTTSPGLNTFTFFRGSTNITTSVTIQDVGGYALTGTATSINSLGGTTGTVVYVTFNTEETIPAGTTYTYTLKALPTGFVNNTSDVDTISTVLATDVLPIKTSGAGAAGDNQRRFCLASGDQTETAIQSLAATVNQTSGTAANIIWSDESDVLHGYVVDTLANGASHDWFNGYLVNGLPLNSIGLNGSN